MTANPDQIRRRIELTRSELSANVNALTEKVTPSRVVARKVDRTRQTVTNVKDRIMGTAENAASAVGDTVSAIGETVSAIGETASSAASTTADQMSSMVSNAVDTVTSAPQTAQRRAQGNPLAVGLIAFGGGWLVASLIQTSRKERELALQAKDRLVDKLEPVAKQVKQIASEVTDSLREPAEEAVESVKSKASDAVESVKSRTSDAASHLVQKGRAAADYDSAVEERWCR